MCEKWSKRSFSIFFAKILCYAIIKQKQTNSVVVSVRKRAQTKKGLSRLRANSTYQRHASDMVVLMAHFVIYLFFFIRFYFCTFHHCHFHRRPGKAMIREVTMTVKTTKKKELENIYILKIIILYVHKTSYFKPKEKTMNEKEILKNNH